MIQTRRKSSQVIDTLFSNRKIDELSDYLTDNSDIDLITLTDNQGNTVLHQLAYEGHIDIIKLFVKEAKKSLRKRGEYEKKKLYKKDDGQQITTWMNQKNNEGFTPLLYASYSGHLDIIKYLTEEYQVNLQLTTNTGLNPLHLAAQKNMVMPFLYFREKINLNQEDNLQSTALHWAAYMNSQQVVAYILSNPNFKSLNHRDYQGNTALLVAVSYGNTRVVRRLLLKGANRYLKNKQNKIPIDIAYDNEFKTITKMLNEKYSCMDLIKFYCNVKIEYQPKKRKYTIPLIFITCFLLNLGILNTLINFTKDYSLYVEALIMGLMILLYLTLLITPTPMDAKDYSELLNNKTQKSIKKICFECRNNIPKRGYHCDTCGICIKQYDHHCTWINNCVGKRNIGRFIFFLLFLILSLGFLGLVSFLAALNAIIDTPLLYKQWFTFRFEYITIFDRIFTIAMLVVNFLTALFVFPVFMLFLVQIKNLLKNKTTYEIIRGPPQEQNIIKEKFRRYNSRLSLRNCRVMCTDNNGSFTTSQSSHNKFTSQKVER